MANTKTNGQWSLNLLLGIAPSASWSGSTETRPCFIHAKGKEMIDAKEEVRVGSISHKILSALATHGNMSASMIKRLGIAYSKTIQEIEDTLAKDLQPLGFVMHVSESYWGLTNKGLEKKIDLGSTDKLFKTPSRSALTKQNELFSRGLYKGEDLLVRCQREGAYDAIELPSRRSDGLHYRKKTI